MEKKGNKKKKPVAKAIMFGALSLTLYMLLFVYESSINSNFARGGLFALLPIGAAFMFSFVHGSFTGSFWSVLGVEASKKKEVR